MSREPDWSSSPLQLAWRKGQDAAWQNRWPGLCLWLFGVALIAGYFYWQPVRAGLETLGDWKQRWGWVFSVCSTAFFGGLLPMFLPLAFGLKPPKSFSFLLVTNCVFWAYKGLEVDWLYSAQAWLFGDDSSLMTVASKVFVDQLVYAPLVGLFNCVVFYVWRDNGFSLERTRRSLGDNWYVRKVLPALISNWCVWLPSVVVIYNLPLALQLPVQNLILCFWVLVLVFFTNEQNDS
jgi:hypothetical protein